jgi:hypothetical protein
MQQVAVYRDRLDAGEHPNILKKELADMIIMLYHGMKYDPQDIGGIEEVHIGSEWGIVDGMISISELLKHIQFCATSGDVRNALS